MKRRNVWMVVIAVSAFVILTLQIRVQSIAQEAPASGAIADAQFQPIAPHHALMESHELAFDEMNKAVSKQKTKDAVNNAWLLAELANVSALHSAEEDYRKWAQELRDQAAGLASLAEKKSFGEAKELSKKIDSTCKACHDKYEKSWKK